MVFKLIIFYNLINRSRGLIVFHNTYALWRIKPTEGLLFGCYHGRRIGIPLISAGVCVRILLARLKSWRDKPLTSNVQNVIKALSIFLRLSGLHFSVHLHALIFAVLGIV